MHSLDVTRILKLPAWKTWKTRTNHGPSSLFRGKPKGSVFSKSFWANTEFPVESVPPTSTNKKRDRSKSNDTHVRFCRSKLSQRGIVPPTTMLQPGTSTNVPAWSTDCIEQWCSNNTFTAEVPRIEGPLKYLWVKTWSFETLRTTEGQGAEPDTLLCLIRPDWPPVKHQHCRPQTSVQRMHVN